MVKMLCDENLTLSEGFLDENDGTSQFQEQDLPRCMNHEMISQLIGGMVTGRLDVLHAASRASNLLDVYLEQPFLLDPFLPEWLNFLVNWITKDSFADLIESSTAVRLDGACQIIYTICKIRGPATVMSFFKSTVEFVVPTMMFAKKVLMESVASPERWMVRYCVILMATVALMTPFDLDQFNKRCITAGVALALFEDVYNLIVTRFGCSGREREAAVQFVSRWHLRKDKSHLLGIFLKGCLENFDLGMLECLCAVVKGMDVESLGRLKEPCRQLLLALDDHHELNRSSLTRKYRIKLYCRLMSMVSISQCLEVFMRALEDADTAVRWTASKSLSKLSCKNGNGEFQSHLVKLLLARLERNWNLDAFPDPALIHGIALCFAELARKGAIPMQFLGEISIQAIKLLVFEVPRGRYAIGSTVRDAACYFVWSMVRNYRLDCIPGDRLQSLGEQLLCVALFDREVSVRRAGAAALQELVGRGGPGTVQDGVEILSAINFFSAHHLRVTYGSLAVDIAAKFPLYLAVMSKHLAELRISNWDRSIRELAAPLLSQLLAVDTTRNGRILDSVVQMSEAFTDLATQHGAILTLSHIMEWIERDEVREPAILSISSFLTSNLVSPKMLGWEMLADSVLRLIAATARHYPLSTERHVATISSWLDACNLGLQSRDDALHLVISNQTLPAIVALFSPNAAVITDYFRGIVLPAADKDRNLNAQRGFTLAIGVMPVWLYAERFGPLNRLLIKMVEGKNIVIDKRVNAIKSLGSLLLAVKTNNVEIPDETSHQEALSALLGALDDYTIDSRGDIGSLVRLAAMQALGNLHADDPRFGGKLVRHMVDKLDKLRIESVKIFGALSFLEPSLSDALVNQGYRVKEFFDLLRPLGAILSRYDADLLDGLLSSAGSVNTLIVSQSLLETNGPQ